MEVFSKGVVVTATLLPLWGKKGGKCSAGGCSGSSSSQDPAPLFPVCFFPCTHLKDQLHDLGMHHAMHRLPVHVGDEVPRTEPCLLGWAPLFHVLGTGCHTVQG